jgi:hypothetical protein
MRRWRPRYLRGDDTAEAQQAAARAGARLLDAKRREKEIRALTCRLRQESAANHFGEAIVLAMARREARG